MMPLLLLSFLPDKMCKHSTFWREKEKISVYVYTNNTEYQQVLYIQRREIEREVFPPKCSCNKPQKYQGVSYGL